MRRFMTVLGMALLGYALLPTSAQAQVIYAQPYRTYSAPIYVAPPVVPTYYYANPSVTTYSAPAAYYPSTSSYYAPAPSVTTYSAPATYSYYPSTTTYYSAAPSVVTYSAPAAVVPAAGVYTTQMYYGYGIFRPRGYYSESYYTPLR